MVRVLISMLVLSLSACAGAKSPSPASEPDLAPPGVALWASCEPEQAAAWSSNMDANPGDSLRATVCYLTLAREAGKSTRAGDLVRQGRKAAAKAVALYPESAVARYAAAYLAGLEAKLYPAGGLSLVPYIEEQGIIASDLDPALDQGGPERMLGDLYLQAPEFPVSIGDPEEAQARFESAVRLAPDNFDNRLGLAKAMVANGELASACSQVVQALTRSPGKDKAASGAAEVLKTICPAIPKQ